MFRVVFVCSFFGWKLVSVSYMWGMLGHACVFVTDDLPCKLSFWSQKFVPAVADICMSWYFIAVNFVSQLLHISYSCLSVGAPKLSMIFKGQTECHQFACWVAGVSFFWSTTMKFRLDLPVFSRRVFLLLSFRHRRTWLFKALLDWIWTKMCAILIICKL